MPRSRSPERDRAFQLWRDSGGEKSLKDIAAELGVSASQVRNWKAQDQWGIDTGTVAQRNANDCAMKRTGAPHGNNNAAGNVGGPGGPARNKKALKTGEHEAIWLDTLEDDERELIGRIETDPMVQLNEEITLLAIRERRMLQRIQRLVHGLTEKQRRVLQERKDTKDAVPVFGDDGKSKGTVVRSKFELVVTEIEETEVRPIEDILRLEDALTRVQEKKLKAIEMKQRHISDDEPDDEEDGLESLAVAIRESASMLRGDG